MHNATPHASTSDNSTGLDDTQISMNISDIENANLDFDFDMSAIAAASTLDILDFNFPASTSCPSPFSAMLRHSPELGDQMALQNSHSQTNSSFSLAHLSASAKARMGYFVEQMKLIPTMMVEQNCTPWMHPMLYEDHMPRCLQDAYAACALYIAKNQTNAERVERHIKSRAEDLVNSTLPDTPLEILARTHALILYQTMFVFGGSLRFFAETEALVPYIQNMGTMLVPIAGEMNEPVGPLPLYPATAAQSAWKSYVSQESARRTVVSAFQITVMCNIFSGQMKNCLQNISLGTSITLSAHLWNATNAFDFAMSWNAKNHFVVKELDFTDVLENAQPDDLDVFANMLLISLQGIDDIRGWYHTRGGTLQIPQSEWRFPISCNSKQSHSTTSSRKP